MSTRIGTFNCENLFSRPKILYLDGTPAEIAESTAALKAAQALQAIIAKPVYSAADKTDIADLIEAGKGYFTLEKDRGKLTNNSGKVIANGSTDFFGHVRFNTRTIKAEATSNTGKVIKALKADVLCIVEVENRETLGDFNSQVLTTKKFAQHMVIDGNDPRGIDVGILSNFPLNSLRSHVHEKSGTSKLFSRDCVEHEVLLPSGQSLWVLCNHLKSKLGPAASSDARRKMQAQRIADILAARFDLTTDLVVVAGDLNDEPGSDPMSPLMNTPHLHNIVDTLPAAQQYTHIYQGNESQLDYLLVSQPLKDALISVEIERRGMHDVPGHFPTVTGEADAASDHAAIVAEFNV
jgi:endonuclease/exonuclease/phosphatase family metal-dependent hydrolase